jgi:hypothetical protein
VRGESISTGGYVVPRPRSEPSAERSTARSIEPPIEPPIEPSIEIDEETAMGARTLDDRVESQERDGEERYSNGQSTTYPVTARMSASRAAETPASSAPPGRGAAIVPLPSPGQERARHEPPAPKPPVLPPGAGPDRQGERGHEISRREAEAAAQPTVRMDPVARDPRDIPFPPRGQHDRPVSEPDQRNTPMPAPGPRPPPAGAAPRPRVIRSLTPTEIVSPLALEGRAAAARREPLRAERSTVVRVSHVRTAAMSATLGALLGLAAGYFLWGIQHPPPAGAVPPAADAAPSPAPSPAAAEPPPDPAEDGAGAEPADAGVAAQEPPGKAASDTPARRPRRPRPRR